jgi:hypothetical protein
LAGRNFAVVMAAGTYLKKRRETTTGTHLRGKAANGRARQPDENARRIARRRENDDRCAMRSSVLSIGIFALTALASCGGSSAPPPAPPSSAASATPRDSKPAQAGQDEHAKQAATIERLTSDEAKSGNCDADHKAALEKLLADVEAGMKAKNGDDGKPLGMQVVGKRVLALNSNAKGVEMSVTGKGTELHVLAYGLKDVSMDVLAGTTAATTLRSPHQRSATASPMTLEVPKIGKVTELMSDSRQVVIKPGQPLEVRLTGQGCAAMISLLKP